MSVMSQNGREPKAGPRRVGERRPASRRRAQTGRRPQTGRADELHVLVLARALGFPNGYATSSRVRLLGRALVEQGASVRVLSTAVSERPPVVENRWPRGGYHGIEYEYTTGTTVRSSSFLRRRLIETRGLATGAARIFALRRARRLDCVYLWWTSQAPTPTRRLVLAGLHALRVPIVIEMNEPPWPLQPGAARWWQRRSPLHGVSGVVSISGFLSTWTREEMRRRSLRVGLIEVPIVVDAAEQSPAPYPAGQPRVVYAASPGYDRAMQFILAAMDVVWQRFPACSLVVTGVNPGDPASHPFLESMSDWHGGRVEVPGHLPRTELLAEYGRAHALLVPLFDDMRSRARFPTKIGEYLASGRPVITTQVGEAERFFTHGIDAFLARPGDAASFGGAICEALEDRERAAAVGRAGRELAERAFHYQVHGARLAAFLRIVAQQPETAADREPEPASPGGIRRVRGGESG